MSTFLTKREPRSLREYRNPLAAIQHDFDSLLAKFWPEGEFALNGGALPMMDVSETDAAVEVKMDLPGMKPDEIHVEVRGNDLVVTGERKDEKIEKDEGRNFYRTERSWGKFARTVSLPCDVVADRIEATYHSGVLGLKMPKAEPSKSKTIKVKAV